MSDEGHVIIAEIRSIDGWDGLHEAFRLLHDYRQTSYESIGKLAGLPDRYVNKLLAKRPMKSLGRNSFGPLLGAYGAKLLVVLDPDATVNRITPRKPGPRRNARGTMRAKKNQHRRGFRGSDMGLLMQQLYMLSSTPAQRRKSARNAARARWKKPRIVEVKNPAEAAAIRDQCKPCCK